MINARGPINELLVLGRDKTRKEGRNVPVSPNRNAIEESQEHQRSQSGGKGNSSQVQVVLEPEPKSASHRKEIGEESSLQQPELKRVRDAHVEVAL